MLEPHAKGPWMLYEDAAARIAELEDEIAERRMDYTESMNRMNAEINNLEAQLMAMQQIIDGYKDDLKIPENVLGVLKLSYRKHHLLDDSVGSTELSDFLMDTICELIGDDGFQKWLDELECCNIVVE